MKQSFLLAFFFTLIQFGHASIEQAPPSFRYLDEEAIFVDIESAHYDISYDLEEKTASVKSTITFMSSKVGYPILDLVPMPTEINIDGISASSEVIMDPDQQTFLRVINQFIVPGKHVIALEHSINTNVVFNKTNVASGFWTSDLNDRRYLEQYLPTNLEFDQYKITMNVKILGAEAENHLLKANGRTTILSKNSFFVEFPEFYTASSVYFHLFSEANKGNTVQFDFLSIDGRAIPVDIYTPYDVKEFSEHTIKILTELESDYGPFPHNKVIIYGNMPSGGMEYSGATATSLRALGHELFHSYHARGLMPANGNAGWMDEAIARWRDNNYPLSNGVKYERTQLAGHSTWSRMTDRMAYTEGSAFLSWIAYRLEANGLSFKSFLKNYFQKFKYTTVTTELFRSEIESETGLAVSLDFDKYIYGKVFGVKKSFEGPMIFKFEEDPNHPILSKQQLSDLTLLKKVD